MEIIAEIENMEEIKWSNLKLDKDEAAARNHQRLVSRGALPLG
jgi:hypothetical protein